MENRSFGNRSRRENSKNIKRGNFKAIQALKIPSLNRFILLRNGSGCRNVRMQLYPILPDGPDEQWKSGL